MTFIHEERFKPFEAEGVQQDGKRRYPIPAPPDYPYEGPVYYESVTTALGDLPGKQEGLKRWRENIGYQEANRITRMTASRGTEVHTLIEDFINNRESIEGHMPEAIQMFGQLKPILEKSLEKIFLQEAVLYSHEYMLAGRVDLVCQILNKLTVTDFKTSRKPKKREWLLDYFLQEASYSFMVEEMYGVKVEQNVLFIAVEQSKPQIFVSDPYKYKDHDFFVSRSIA